MITSLHSAATAAATLLRALALAVVGTGLLYLLAPIAPGAGLNIPDALPLDELPGRSGAPLLLFVLAWAAAAWASGALGLLPQRILAASIALFACQVVLNTVSLGIVRQVRLLPALPAALSTPAPYLATVIAAVVATAQRRRALDER